MKLLVALAFVSSCSALSAGLDRVFENFRQLMRTGDPDRGIPVLDPLRLDTYDFHFNASLIGMNIQSEGVDAIGLSDFKVHDVDMTMIPLAVTFDVTMPATIVRTEKYDFYGMIFHALPIYGKGNSDFEIGNFYFKGISRVSVGVNGVYLRDLNLELQLGSLKSKTTGMLGGGDIDDVINAILADLAPDFFNKSSKLISKAVSGFVLTRINAVLDGMTLADFIDLITGQSQ